MQFLRSDAVEPGGRLLANARRTKRRASMARPRRYTPPDSVLHLVNRGNDRKRLFEADREYEEFLRLVAEVKERCPMRLLAYCVMPNHWHMVVWPEPGQSVTAFCHRLCTIHAIRHRRETGTIGNGHLYQDRYHSFAIESERQYYAVMRYVEANGARSRPGRARRAVAVVQPGRARRPGPRPAVSRPAVVFRRDGQSWSMKACRPTCWRIPGRDSIGPGPMTCACITPRYARTASNSG